VLNLVLSLRRFAGDLAGAPCDRLAVLPPTSRSVARMTGLGKAADRKLERRRLAAVGVFGWYRRRRSDALLVSFPECGRSWLRVMVGRAFQLHFGLPDHTDLSELGRLTELDRRVPGVLVTHDDDAHSKPPAEVERDKSRYRHRRVVLLVRDPRDVIVSLYHQLSARRDRYHGTLAEFVNQPVGGFASLLAFYDAWAAALDVPAALLVVRYEDLHARPEAELAQVLAFEPDVAAGRLFEPQHQLGGRGLSASGLTNQPERPTGRDYEGHAVHRPDHIHALGEEPPLHRKELGEIARLEERPVRAHARCSRSSVSIMRVPGASSERCASRPR